MAWSGVLNFLSLTPCADLTSGINHAIPARAKARREPRSLTASRGDQRLKAGAWRDVAQILRKLAVIPTISSKRHAAFAKLEKP